MIVNDFFFSLLIAVLLSMVFVLLIRREGPRKGFTWLLLTIFLATWAGGAWGNLLSPDFFGIFWLPYLLAGLSAAILLWIFLPKFPEIGGKTQLDREETLEVLEQVEKTREMEKLTYVTIDVFLVLILLLLIVAIVGRYLRNG